MTSSASSSCRRFDYTDERCAASASTTAMARRSREQGWLAQAPFGYMVLDREAGEFFLRTQAGDLPRA